ncbi:unnamed protein product [Heligmosomoides polygyrus]|uniref:Uncharacterized protein n=1 Tax=Heligmosomoides polygyrus TaxID=6339 RepID=A0A3P7XT50_HELPZ|nr:unnamed protein product [Heligmosomoides polygyrus]
MELVIGRRNERTTIQVWIVGVGGQPSNSGFNCGPLYNRGCDDDDVDGNEEEGLEHEEELVGESSEEAIEGLEQEFRDVFSRAERKKIVKG